MHIHLGFGIQNLLGLQKWHCSQTDQYLPQKALDEQEIPRNKEDAPPYPTINDEGIKASDRSRGNYYPLKLVNSHDTKDVRM